MCGIVGLYLKNKSLEDRLGVLLSTMLIEMTERGPDSTGVAVYRDPVDDGFTKLTVLTHDRNYRWQAILDELQNRFGDMAGLEVRGNHAVVIVQASDTELQTWFEQNHPDLTTTSSGQSIEIFKEKGLPKEVIEKFEIKSLSGTHALGHTRMATESAVTTEHSHPFSTGLDLCLVHNGSLSNHNRWRRKLRHERLEFQTDNDSEVAAGYLMWRMREGATLDEALESAIVDLDGFYTFAIGISDGFAVLRDPIACKPAVLAETDDWVAMASEFRSISHLPGVENARIWEPEPAKIYSWHRH